MDSQNSDLPADNSRPKDIQLSTDEHQSYHSYFMQAREHAREVIRDREFYINDRIAEFLKRKAVVLGDRAADYEVAWSYIDTIKWQTEEAHLTFKRLLSLLTPTMCTPEQRVRVERRRIYPLQLIVKAIDIVESYYPPTTSPAATSSATSSAATSQGFQADISDPLDV